MHGLNVGIPIMQNTNFLPKSQQFWLNGLHKQKTSFVNIDEALQIELLTING